MTFSCNYLPVCYYKTLEVKILTHYRHYAIVEYSNLLYKKLGHNCLPMIAQLYDVIIVADYSTQMTVLIHRSINYKKNWKLLSATLD